MKILNRNLQFRSLFYWVIFLGAVTIFFFSGDIPFSFQVQKVCLALAVLSLFTPLGHRVANLPDQKKPRWFHCVRCIAFTWFFQLALYSAFYAICHLTASTFPVGIESFNLFGIAMPLLLLDWGVFPWGAYALFALALSYVRYSERKSTQMSTGANLILSNQFADAVSMACDTAGKAGISFVLGSTLGLLVLEIVGLLGTFFGFQFAYGFRMDLLLFLTVILQWQKKASFDIRIGRFRWHQLSPIPSLVIYFVLISIVFFLVSTLVYWLSPMYTPILSQPIGFIPADWPIIWLIFMGIWWLCWAPLAAGTLIKIWQGYRFRTMVFWTLCLPVIATICIYNHMNWHLFVLKSMSLWYLVPPLFGLSAMLYLFFRPSTISYVFKAQLLPEERCYRSYRKPFLVQLIRFVIVAIGFYWVGGIYLMGWICFAFFCLVALLVLTVGIGSVRVFFKRASS